MSRKLDIWDYAIFGLATLVACSAGYGYFNFVVRSGDPIFLKAVALFPTIVIAGIAWLGTGKLYNVFEDDTDQDEENNIFKAKVNKYKI